MPPPAPPIAWPAFREVYVSQGFLTAAQFESLFDTAVQIKALGVAGEYWSITHQILSVHRQVPLLTHYEAMSKAFGFPVAGPLAFHQEAIRQGISPNWSLNVTHFYEPPPAGLPIGQTMSTLGLVEDATVKRALDVQQILQRRIGVKVALASLVVSMAPVSFPDFYQALGIHSGLPYRTLDESAPAIFDDLGKRISQKK